MRLTTRLSLPRSPLSVTYARRVLEALLSLSQVADARREQLGLLFTEACTNAVVHATGDAEVEVDITIDPEECVVEVGNRDGESDHRALNTELPDPLAEGGRG